MPININKRSDVNSVNGKVGDVVLNASDIGALSKDTKIPTKISELINDSNYISDANYVHTDNNYTNEDKNKLNNIANGAEVNVQANWSETDPMEDSFIKNKPTIPSKTSDLTNDSNYIADSDYKHTDNNYTTADKNSVATIGNKVDKVEGKQLSTNDFTNDLKNKLSIAYDHSQKTSGNPHNVTKGDVGLGNVGNFKAVSTVASQGLTDTEKANARTNIGAGTGNSNFSGAYADLTGKPTLGTAASKNVASSGNASTTQVVMGNDTRLTDARKASDVYAWAKASTKPSYTKSEVGLGNVDNTADADKSVKNADKLYNKSNDYYGVWLGGMTIPKGTEAGMSQSVAEDPLHRYIKPTSIIDIYYDDNSVQYASEIGMLYNIWESGGVYYLSVAPKKDVVKQDIVIQNILVRNP